METLMGTAARSTNVRHRAHAVAGIARVIASMAFVVSVAPLVSCAHSDRVTAVIVGDTELIGLWRGPMRGPWGNSVLTLRLHADSSLTADNEDTRYSRINGVWTVSDRCFTASASTADSVVVTLVAFAPFVHLTGTWTSNGRSGTFDLAKR